MTIEEAKDLAAIEAGFRHWEHMESDVWINPFNINRAIKIYADAKAKEAFEAARKFDFEAGKNYVFADYEDYKNSKS